MKPRTKIGLAVLSSVATFGVSLFFDATHYANIDHSGPLMLGLGWIGPISFQVGWYANPLLLTGWIMLLVTQRRGLRVATAVILGFALVLALSSYLTLAFGPMMLGPNEGAMAGDFQGFGLAIVFWTLAIMIAFAASLTRVFGRSAAGETGTLGTHLG